MPLSDAQRAALPMLRAQFNLDSMPLGTAQSVDERARAPDPAIVPTDVAIRVEIAPPSSHPHPLLAATNALRTPERVPIFFFSLQGDQQDGSDDGDVSADPDTRVIFFIHGGANIVGHPAHNEPFVHLYARLLRAVAAHPDGAGTKCVLIAPSYRLASVPENAFPAALQDVVAAHEYVLAKGYNASNIVIAGDSAGGNHAIVLTHLLLKSGVPSPRGVVAIAPACMLEPELLSEYAKSQASNDTLDSIAKQGRSLGAYVGDSGMALADPLVSGAFLPFTPSWPKTLIIVGSGDQLIDGAREVEKRLAALNAPVELVEYDERPHGWWVLPELFQGENEDAAQRIAQFTLH